MPYGRGYCKLGKENKRLSYKLIQIHSMYKVTQFFTKIVDPVLNGPEKSDDIYY